MEQLMQNLLMAGVYSALCWIVLRSRHRKSLAVFEVCCAISAVYNLFYGTLANIRIATSIALAVRLSVPVVALWRTMGRRSEDRIALGLLSCSLACGACVPSLHAWGYLEVRTMLTSAVAIVCLLACIEHLREPFQTERIHVDHLHLQTLWITAHAIISASGPWCLSDLDRWLWLRWGFIAVSVLVVHAYAKAFNRSPAVPEEASACRRAEE